MTARVLNSSPPTIQWVMFLSGGYVQLSYTICSGCWFLSILICHFQWDVGLLDYNQPFKLWKGLEADLDVHFHQFIHPLRSTDVH